jgi:hypothetical protein
MRKTSAYFISTLILSLFLAEGILAQDTIVFPLKIKVGAEVSGPAIYFTDKNILNTEGNVSVDLNEKRAVFFGTGYLNYKYSQYNYEYFNKGLFFKGGVDFNLLKPEKSIGRYWAGIGLRYGLSIFNSGFPSFTKENNWGKTESSIAAKTSTGHFIEIAPGVRTELFRNLSVGWNVSLRMLIYSSAGKNLKPIYIPGFGNGSKTVVPGINYYIVWSIPYKKIKVAPRIEVPEEPEETEEQGKTGQSGNRQQSTGIRQQQSVIR